MAYIQMKSLFKAKRKPVIIFSILLILILLLPLYSMDILTIENIKNHKMEVRHFIENNYIFSVLIFFISCTVFINSPIPFAAVIKLLGGFFFGLYLGAFYNITATTIACLIGFGISRYAFKDTFEKLYYKRLIGIENEIEKNGFYYFLSLRLVLVVPYFLINILGGISRIPFKKYLFSTTVGVIPASFIYANGGSKLERINSVSELFGLDILFALALMIGLSLFPIIRNNFNLKKSCQ